MKPTLRRYAALLTLALLCSMTLTACEAIRTTAMRASSACAVFRNITFSAVGDTRETISQIRGHNAARDALCATTASNTWKLRDNMAPRKQ